MKNASIKQIFTSKEHAGPFCLAEAKLTNRYQTLNPKQFRRAKRVLNLKLIFLNSDFVPFLKLEKNIPSK